MIVDSCPVLFAFSLLAYDADVVFVCFVAPLTITPHTYASPSSAVAQPNVDWIGDILIPTFIISSHWIVLACVWLWLGVIIIFLASTSTGNEHVVRSTVISWKLHVCCLFVLVCLLGRRCSIDMIES